MSNVKPNNINGGYPIAGIDNDSQGFRDNFTNIKNNFTTIKTELDDLQGKVLLKQALTGIPLNNTITDVALPGQVLQAASETYIDNGADVAGAITINWALGHLQEFHLTADTNISFTGWPTSGKYGKVRLLVTPDPSTPTTADLTFPAEVSIFGTSVTNRTLQVVNISSTATRLYELSTKDAGLTVMMFQLI